MNQSIRVTAVALCGVLLMGCSMFRGGDSHDFVMTGTPHTAAAGAGKVTTTDDGNTQISLQVKHLPPPEKISSEATAFVVWVKNNDEYSAEPQNLGALKVDEDLDGSITAVTNLRSFDLYVTAEATPRVTTPTGETLLRTNVVMESLSSK